MPYFARQVGRAKGIGKIVHWDQGGGPKKAGLGPQIDVTTWGRRVIARRTNNCCCDPIELTSIRLSIPWGNYPQIFTSRIPWNYWQSGANESQSLGALVGPPRNDVVNGQIQTQNQIYSIVTFNKPISGNLSSSLVSPTYTPSVPTGTTICVCGLEQVTAPTSTATVCVQDSSILVASVMRYYDIAQRYTRVTQIPGGTATDTFTPTAANNFTTTGPTPYTKSGHLTSGSRVLVEAAPGIGGIVGAKPSQTVQVNNPVGGVTVDMWSGDNNKVKEFGISGESFYFNGSTTAVSSEPWQPGGTGATIDPKYFGGYNTPLMDVSNGGFAINSSSFKSSGNPGGSPIPSGKPPIANRYIGNGYGIHFTSNGRAEGLFNSPQVSDSIKRNIALVQGDLAANKNEFYSADALYVSDGPVDWLDYDHALFINITSLMQVGLKNTLSRGAPVPPGQPSAVWGPPADNIGGHPANTSRQIWSPATTTNENQGGIITAPTPQTNAAAWQGWGIKQTPVPLGGGATFNAPFPLPAWADLIGSDYGNAFEPDITFDASGNVERYGRQNSIGFLPPTNGFNNIFPSGGGNIAYNPDAWGATLGDVVEKLRQLTYSAFPSYTIQNILRSKYDCGNDGFDGPVDDIRLSSGSAANKAIASANQAEGGILNLLA